MEDHAEAHYPTFAVLSFATALLSFAIHAVTGEWPSELELWGTVAFVLLGVAIVGLHWFNGSDVGTESTKA